MEMNPSKTAKTKCLLTFLLANMFALPAAFAAEITGTISFIKKPPMVGIVYVPSSQSDQYAPVIDQVDKQFTSKMAVVNAGNLVTFKNSDDVEHNVFANDTSQSAKFDVGLMSPGGEKKIKVDWDKNSIVRVGCKIHPKMRTYLAAIDTPFHQILEFQKGTQEYTFSIKNVPADSNKVVFSIPKYDLLTVELTSGSIWTAEITKKGKVRGLLTINQK
ncbi:hypothetical protein J8L86_04400 [Shewanella sp. MMG014]|uniref:hypothetical protein n=1 Tax=Shewanella sp. MMG014 TaxID=2822691 RepID=UPI001B379E67|nr:hypothetical protein [Shewanella sp. MMG014]MBQ4889075.1 hypothetical protein [Shewanella sp. MMG014]